MSYLLRVTVPDRPGSLGALAVALGSADADILSLDVVERLGGIAVDDIVVDVPFGTLPDTLITAAESLDGVVVDSLQPFVGIRDAHRELELIDAVSSAGAAALQRLADEVPAVLRVGWAQVLICEGSACRVDARGASAPTSDDRFSATLAELSKARAVEPEEVPESWSALDTVIAAAPLGAGRLLVIGRPGGPDFRLSEIARFGHFAGILRTLYTA